MPVILPPEPGSDSDVPRPPNAVVWIALFAVFMVGGAVIALLTWPKTEPTQTPWFWVRLLVLPATTFGLVFGLRLLYYEQELDRLQAEDEARQQDRKKAIRFASEPLAVLGCAYLSGLGNVDLASKVARGDATLEAQTAADGAEGVRHTALGSIEGETQTKRYRACFNELLAIMKPKIEALPRDVVLNVRLQIPSDSEQDERLDAWRDCWRLARLRRAEPKLLNAKQGLMALDEWLDVEGGPNLEKFTLFVSVQLHDPPPEGSAEASVAALLGWAPIAARRGLDSLAMLHRPVEAEVNGLHDAVAKIGLWGKADAADVNDLWEAGLSGADRSALLDVASEVKWALTEAPGFDGIHDIDSVIGHPGVCAGWLAVAAAVEHAGKTGNPQAVAWREGGFRLAVVQPVAQSKEEVESNA